MSHLHRSTIYGTTTNAAYGAATHSAATRLAMCVLVLILIPQISLALPGNSPDWVAAEGDASDNFAADVNTAGDVNGDGYSDVLISCPGLNGDLGAAFVYCGGPNGLGTSPCWQSDGNQPGRQYSNASFPAGDVNGDGYADVIVGARGYDSIGASGTLEGAVFVFHGSPSGLSPSADWEVLGEIEDMELGKSVSTAGDVNADGYDDVLVYADLGGGTIRLYYGSASGLSASWGWRVAGVGSAFAAAGDVNGDGYDDILTGKFLTDRAYVFLGSATGPSFNPDWTGVGPADTRYGYSVAPAGDVDGDGYADILMGAPHNGAADTGRAWIAYGSSSGPGPSLEFGPSILPIGAEFGIAVQSAGDINADGFSDVLVGAHFFTGTESAQGRSYLYLGGAGGLVASGWIFDGTDSNAYLGRAVSGAGDINGDGLSDILLGAPSGTLTEPGEGVAYAFYSTGSQLSETAATSELGDQNGANLGFSVAYAGDLNGDGLGDCVAGGFRYDGDFVDEGTLVVWHGSRTGGPVLEYATQIYGSQDTEYLGMSAARAGDVNADGYDDLLVGAPLRDGAFTGAGAALLYHGSATGISTTPDWTSSGSAETAWHGFGLAGAGDVNADGFADVIVGSLAHTGTMLNQGAARLYLGSETGLSSSADWMVEGTEASELLGQSVAGVGDLNGDGFSDIAVVAPNHDGNFPDAGATYVYYGSASGPATTPDWTALGVQAGAGMSKVAGAGDVNGDGFDDLLIATEFYTADISQEGRVDCYFGSPAGPGALPDWTVVGSFTGGWLGRSISTAGDVNRDGYADILIGEENSDGTFTDEGSVHVYHGGPSGLTLGSVHTGLQQDGSFGSAASTAGDLNGDGFADIIVGANTHDGTHTDGGAMFVFLGNNDANGAGGLSIQPQQKTTTGAPITWLGASDSPTQFKLAAHGRTTMGRGRVRLEWQIAEVGTPLEAMPIEQSLWHDSGAPTAELGGAALIEEDIFGLAADTQYHWRLRTRSRSLYAPATSWVSMAPTAASMAHLRTAGTTSEVPAWSVRSETGIEQMGPNPFADETTISFRTQRPGAVRMTVHDVSGREVARVIDTLRSPGRHVVSWSGLDGEGERVPSGLYLIRLTTPDRVDTRKVWVTR